jgi:hypothetical protein
MLRNKRVLLVVMVILVLFMTNCTLIQCAGGIGHEVNIQQGDTNTSTNDIGIVALFLGAVLLLGFAVAIGMGAGGR